MMHLLLGPHLDWSQATIACGQPAAQHATWDYARVDCPACLGRRAPCSCDDTHTCAVCQAWTRTHHPDGSRRAIPREPTVRTEKDLQEAIRQAALAGGWLYYHTYSSRHSPPGFPDCVLVRGKRLFFIELKMPSNPVTTAQRQWLDALGEVLTVERILCYPADLPTILEELR